MSVKFNFKPEDKRKTIIFYFIENQQSGGTINQQGPVNVLRRGPLIYYSINYDQYKNFYDFYDEGKIVDRFFNSVKDLFASGKSKKYKIQGYFEVKNYQQTEFVELENTRVWLTKMFVGRYFGEFIRSEMKKYILKRIRINGSTVAIGCLNDLINSKSLSLTRPLYYLVNFFCFSKILKMDYIQLEGVDESQGNEPQNF